jgi:RNA polymerase sigma-70 factor (ECF subfamily)
VPDRFAARPSASDWPVLLAAARRGSPGALGRLLDHFRPYLLAVAAAELDSRLTAKAGPSDLVQESLLEGQRDFAAFRGAGTDELRAWLRQILLHNLAHLRRHYRATDKRDVAREMPLHAVAGHSAGDLPLTADPTTPSRLLARAEAADRLRAAVARLPEHYRLVIQLHHFEGLTFAAVGERLGRSLHAARQLWWHALWQLRDALKDES